MSAPFTVRHNDNGSIDYVTPLGRPFIVVGEYHAAVSITRWYNHTTRDWVVMWTTAEGWQVGPSTYVYSKVDALDEVDYRVALAGGTADPSEPRPGH